MNIDLIKPTEDNKNMQQMSKKIMKFFSIPLVMLVLGLLVIGGLTIVESVNSRNSFNANKKPNSLETIKPVESAKTPPVAQNLDANSNKAALFDGSNDIITGKINPDFYKKAFTVEAFIYPTAEKENGIIAMNGDSISGWSFEINDGNLAFWVGDGIGDWHKTTGNTILEANKWYHVAAVFNDGKAQVFIDGKGSSETEVGTTVRKSEFSVGGYSGYGFFHGKIDDLRISTDARYVDDFTMPETELDSDDETEYLYKFDNAQGQHIWDSGKEVNNLVKGSDDKEQSSDPEEVESREDEEKEESKETEKEREDEVEDED